MSPIPPKKAANAWRRARQVSLASITLAFTIAACTDDAIVYPNRNQSTGGGGATSEAGVLAAAGEAGGESGGASSIDGGDASTTGGGSILGDDEGGVDAAGASGAASGNGAVCGNGIVEPPEECDDGNTVSGDGCSAQCLSHCETCEDKVCSLLVYDYEAQLGAVYDSCYKTAGNVTTGPAGGAVPPLSRAQVCAALVDCIRREKCAQPYAPGDVKFNRCWCDVDWTPSPTNNPGSLCSDPTTFVPGKCASQFQDASEADKVSAVIPALTKTSTALGAAMRMLVGCDERVCTEECLPEYFGDHVVASITQDLTSITNPAGESQVGDLTADAARAAAGSDAAIVSGQFALCQGAADDPSQTLSFAATPNRLADADGRVLWSEALATQECYGGLSITQSEYLNTVGSGSAIVKAIFTGQQLYDALAAGLNTGNGNPLYVSGLAYTWTDAPREIVEIRKDGAPIDKAASFTVALSTVLASKTSPIPQLSVGANPSVVPNSLPATLFGQYLSQLPQPVSPLTLDRISTVSSAGSGGSSGSAGSSGSGGGP